MTAPLQARPKHCWMGHREWILDGLGCDAQAYLDTFRDEWVEGTCMLPDGRGPHEFTPDGEIEVRFL